MKNQQPVKEDRRPLNLYDAIWLMFLYLTLTESLWYAIPAFLFFPLWVQLIDMEIARIRHDEFIKSIQENEHNQEIAEDETEAE